MNYSELELALVAAGRALSAGSLGRDLRRFHPGRRGSPETSSMLAGMELNHPPPIQRTVRILFTARGTNFDLRLTNADREYLAWVQSVILLLQGLVDSWWGGINPDLRLLFVDGDDAPPIVLLNTMFPGLRIRRPPSLGASGAALGLGSAEFSALSRCGHAARRTPVFAAAAEVAGQIRSSARRRAELLRERSRMERDLNVRWGRGVDVERDRIRRLIESGYDQASDWAQKSVAAFRGYNELVNGCLAFLLGYSEAGTEPSPLSVEEGQPISIEWDERNFQVHLTFTKQASLITDAVFRLEDGGPLDGLYLDAGAGFQFAGQWAIVDRHGLRIRDLELVPF